MPPPLLPPFALRIGRAIAHQTLYRNDLPEPLPGRFGKMATPAPACRNVILDGAHRRHLGAIADVKMVVDPHLGSQRHIVADGQTAGQPDLGRQQTMPPDRHIVTDLDLIVDFGALADHGVAQAAAVDGRSRADLAVVLDPHAPGLRYLQMTVRSKKDKTIAILTDAAARVDQDVVAQ